VAAGLASDYYCVAVDLSGHGDSQRRTSYPVQVWIDELSALAGSDLFQQAPTIIGHSMGGLLGIGAGSELGGRLAGLVIVDAAARPGSRDGQRSRAINLLGRQRSYASREEAIARFRLIPPQAEVNAELLRWIAEQSVCRSGERWQWKYDYRAYRDRQPMAVHARLATLRCRVAIIRGEHSRILRPDTLAQMQSRLVVPSMAVEIPAAHHHLVLDQPLALTAALRGILACWHG
jgi:pimeloyl-ACP methyl ester carboxylesterase